MNPLRLELQAFGPYVERQSIPFDRLGAQGIFLIHGPTGSGKSTLLDAMCFALYGVSSGDLRVPGDLRSHHAGPGLATEVVFEFSLGLQRYRVLRQPGQDLLKKRGEGTTFRPAEAVLEELGSDPGGKVLATVEGWEKVSRRIQTLLGMQEAQFRQVVLLPQGQFQKFLLASSDEKESLLKVIFQTGLYEEIQKKLAGRAAELGREQKELRTRVQQTLDNEGVGSLEALQEASSQRGVRIRSLEGLIQVQAGQVETARQDLGTGRRTMELLANLGQARAAWIEVEAREPHRLEVQRQVTAGRQAAGVFPFAQALAQADHDHEDLRNRVATLVQDLRADTDRLARAETILRWQEAPAQEQAQRLAQDSFQAAGARVLQFERVAAAFGALHTSRQAWEQNCDGHAKALADQEQFQTLLERRTAELRLAQDALAGLPALERELQDLRRRAKILAQAAELNTRLGAAKLALGQAQAECAGAQAGRDLARTAVADLEQLWRAGQAEILARTLQADHPCPVCGALEHPAPAAGATGTPAEAALETARERLQAAQATLEDHQHRTRGAELAHARLEAELGALSRDEAPLLTLNPEQLQADLAALAATFAHQQGESRRLPDLEQRLAKGQGLLAEAADKARAAETERLALQTTLNHQTGELMGLMADLAPETQARILGREGSRTLADLKLELQRAQTAAELQLETLNGQLRLAREAQAQAAGTVASQGVLLTERQRRLEELLERRVQAETSFRQAWGRDFASRAAYDEARCEPERLRALAAEASALGEARLKAETTLQGCETAAQGLVAVALPALEDRCQALDQALTEARNELAALSAEWERLAGLGRTLDALGERIRAGDAAYAVVGDLANLANGDNGRKLSFHRFVQQHLLDQVLGSASQRLQRMSRGQFSLHRAQGVRDARQGSGLDLEAFDSYTGRRRPVSSLSGGEAFMASLCLALGLSDIVQSFAGGVKLDTVLIDEGFGSLDQDGTLEEVMKTIFALKDHGRLVGIISHVREMRDRIDSRIEITKTPAGSELRIVTP